ncbi:Uncharacterised protein [Afipia felis]|uniref:Uncharacterized protein n=2 Tax=Afipia felis TaxID=1035 RepID=A0A380W3N6_AFIFE|nr:hypothetical protein HMPREF9697_03268 [Afipia felis ATCC 53690]SUU75485.1 Uncharacterised protein [Afipia felis]SUU83552.1 Uncharacterised protein [Afipia felis]
MPCDGQVSVTEGNARARLSQWLCHRDRKGSFRRKADMASAEVDFADNKRNRRRMAMLLRWFGGILYCSLESRSVRIRYDYKRTDKWIFSIG